MNGLGVEKDQKRAIKLFEDAATKGCLVSITNLGCMYLEGLGVEQNIEKAVQLFKHSAESGDAHALCVLGRIYNEGRGVQKDPDEAVKWFKQAVEKGNIEAMCHLSLMYEKGLGVEQSAEKAFKLVKQAAERGHLAAMTYLGKLYEEGRVVERDRSEAIKWLEKATTAGDQDAQKYLISLLQQRSKFEGMRVFALVEYRDSEPLILNFHKTRECKNLEKEFGSDVKTLRDTIRNPDRMSEILRDEYVPEQGILILEELVGTENENEFIAADGSLHIIAPCRACFGDEDYENQPFLTVEKGYNICLIFLLRLWPLVAEQIRTLDSDVIDAHSFFYEIICFEAESYAEWHDAIYRITQISTHEEPSLTLQGLYGMEKEEQEPHLIKLSLNQVFLSMIEFCRIYNERLQTKLSFTIDLLEAIKIKPEEYSEILQIWNGALVDVIEKRKYICDHFFWKLQFRLERFSEDTPEARKLILGLFEDSNNKVGSVGNEYYKKDVYLKTLPDGKQLWGYLSTGERAFSQKNEIADAGIDQNIGWSEDPAHENGGRFYLMSLLTK